MPSALLENISGIYLYATLVSALPLYATVIARALEKGAWHPQWLWGCFRGLPGNFGPILLALLLFASFALALTAAAAVIVKLQSTWI